MALSSGKIDKSEYLVYEVILPSDQSRTVKPAKSAYSPLGKAFEKQIKTNEDQGEKHVKALKPNAQLTVEDATPEDQLNEELKNEIE